jgi:hypothetical protein
MICWKAPCYPCGNHGKVVGKPREKPSTLGKPRENHGKTMNKYEKLGPSTAFVDWMDSLGDIIIKYY